MAPRNKTSTTKPKRVRRKCTAPGCENRVVQGGVCVSHGAKRKLCSTPGCDKAVKLVGFCSSHGPTRKKCDYIDTSSGGVCSRVAVQGGRCLSHGARRRFCAFSLEVCTKNAVADGYCKKHHDLVEDASGMLVLQSSPSVKSDNDDIIIKNNAFCMPVGVAGVGVSSGASSASMSDQSVTSSSAATGILRGGMGQQGRPPMSLEYEQQVNSLVPHSEKPAPKKTSHGSKFPKPHHKRGLSIFDEMGTVNAIISMGEKQLEPTTAAAAEGVASLASSQHKKVKQAPEEPHLPPQQQYTDSTKTPNTQVTFADGTRQSQEAPVTAQSNSQEKEICLQNPSCTCTACRSPTLAIFEQMIQASHKLERGEIGRERYAGLSPPKLSPSKRPSASSKYNKSVKFPDEGPSSSTSVARKVVSNDNFGEKSSLLWNQGHANGGFASNALAHAVKVARDDDDYASSTIQSMPSSRTVSHDVESPRSRYYHHHYYGYPPYHHQHHHHHQSQHYYHNQHPPHPYYYNQQPHPQHYYQHHEPTPPAEAPGTPILSDVPPEPTVSASEARREKRKQQKRLLPKPRGKSLEHLFIPSEAT